MPRNLLTIPITAYCSVPSTIERANKRYINQSTGATTGSSSSQGNSKSSTQTHGTSSSVNVWKLVFSGIPISNNALYWHKGHIKFIQPKARVWKEFVAWEARRQWKGAPLKGRLSVAYTLYFPNKVHRDLANYDKATSDSLTGIVWEDDALIDFISFKRELDNKNPRVEITVTTL